MNLIELLKQYSLLENDEGELSEDWEQRMDLLGDTINAKIDNSCKLIKSWESHANACAQEIERLQKLRAHYEKRAEGLRAYVAWRIGAEKIDTGLHRVYAKQTEAVEVLDEATIPDAYMRVKVKETREPDKQEIKKDLKLGALIEGVRLKKNVSLVIK